MVAGPGPLRPAGQGRPVVTEEGEAVSRSPGLPRGEALPVGPDLGRCHVPARRHCRYPGRRLLLRHRRAPVSRYGAGPGHCRRGQAQQLSTSMGPGQPDGPTRVDRRRQGLQALNIGALGPGGVPGGLRRRGRDQPFPTPASRTRPSHQSPLPRHPDRGDQRPRVRR